MSEGPDTAHSGPVSNPGLVTTNLTPASSVSMSRVTTQPPAPIPLLSIPTHSNGPTASTQQATTGVGDPNNLQPKIPPLMGIRTDTLPPPPPVQLPSTVSTHTSGDMSVASDGAPRLEGPPHLQNKTQELDHEEDSDGEDGKGEGAPASQGDIMSFHPKLLLRLRKSGDDESFEKQDATKNDSYCWVCHDGGDVLCCDKCPRVFHIQCSGLSRAPEGDEEWYCPVCKNIARKTKRSRPANLKDLLLLAVNRMMFVGTEIFQKPVPPDIMTHYKEYIFHPMDLGRIKEKVAAGNYQSTREFTHDAEWILHNCIIYNGAKHALTKISKGIIKVCKEDMREIELCPGCYELTVKQPKDWFCTPCNPPHPVMLAKVRGYPLWPAKLISETSDKCDVRFFGQHDRSIVPKSAIQELNGLPPKPSTKTQHWNIAMLELKKYGENIEAMREKMGLSKSSDKLHKSFKSKESKLLVSRGETQQTTGGQHNNHLDQRGEHHLNGGSGTGSYSISNHIPPSAAVVEVNPSGTDDNKSSHLLENQALSEPSSPGSPRDLQIDLDHSRSPGKKRMGGSANVLNAIRRNIPGSLDLNESVSPQAVGSNLSQLSRGVKGRKAGDRLSAVLSNLTRRAASVMGGQGGAVTPINVTIGGSGASALESMDTEDSEEANGQGQSDNPFSSIYHDRNKTAIALVDPDSHKRKRNVNKRFTDQQPPAKKSKVQANASSKPSSKESSAGGGTSTTEPALITTSTPEITVNNTSLSFVNLRPEVPSAVGSSNSVSPQSLTGSPKGKGQHQHQHQQNQVHGSGAAGGGGHTPGGPTGRQNSATTGKKKSKSKSKQSSHSRSPTKGVSKASSSAPNRALVTTGSSSTNASASAASAAVNSLTQSPSHAAAAAAAATTSTNGGGGGGQDSLSNLRIGVRGEEAAPGIEDDDSNDFAEGSGLFADTVRKVNQSFRARVNHLTGNSDDMGYQYFTEKMMTSVKAILTEMLSTFEAKSRMSAKQLKDQLHTCWPVPHSRVTLDQLKKELRDEMKQSLEVVRAAADLEMQQVVNEVRRQVEKEKEIAIAETKRKKWCSYCLNEAQYNCCWNANYCNEACQQNHWPEHMKNCTQVQQQQQPQAPPSARTPGPTDGIPTAPGGGGGGGTPVATAAPLQFHPSMALMSNSSVATGGGTPPPVFTSGQQQEATGAHQQNLFYMARSAAAAVAAASGGVRTPQGQGQQGQGQPGMPHQQHISVVSQIPTGSLAQQQQGEGGGVAVLAGHAHTRSSISREGSHPVGSPYIQVDSVPSQQQQQQQHGHGMEQHSSPSLEQSMARIEHIPNESIRESIMISSANTASPPNHIRNMLLSHQQQQQQQQQQQASRKSPVIAGANSLQLGGHQGQAATAATMSALGMPAGAHLGMMTDNPAAAAAAAAALASAQQQQQQHHGLGVRNITADHSHPSIHGHAHGHPHGQAGGAPMSPASTTSENNPPSVHNFAAWSYHHGQQPVIIGGQEAYPGLSIHQAMQANTSTSQNQAFYKTF